MTNNEKNYWRSEYENLRRKKNKIIANKDYQMSKVSNDLYDYLTSRGMLEDYIKFKQERNKQ